MKLERATYSIGEAIRLIADEKAPLPPKGKGTKLRLRSCWFPPGAWDERAPFSPIRFPGDSLSKFPGDFDVQGADCRIDEAPGELD